MKFGKFVPVFLCIAAISNAAADGRDGLVHWWKVKDLNGDGLLQAAEVYDVMTVSSEIPLAASDIVQNTDSEMAEPASIGTGVTFASMRKTVDDAVYFSLNNPTNYVDGGLVANWQSITLPREASIGCDEATVIARFRWHGCRSKKNNAGGGYNYGIILYANNYYPNGARGWRVGLRCYDSSTSTLMYPSLHIGNGKSYIEFGSFGAGSSFLVRKGLWCDFAVTFKRDSEGNVTAFFVLRNSDFGENRDRIHYTFTKTGTLTADSEDKFPKPGVYQSYIGYNGMTGFNSPLSRGEDTFGGDIHDIRVYDRMKGEYEILSEFTDSAPLFAVGSANSSGDEFSDDAPAEVFRPASMEWSKMRKTLDAGTPSVSVACDVEANGSGLGRLVELKFVEGDVAARIEVSANGRIFGRKRVGSDGWVRFFIPPSVMSSLRKDENTGMYPLTLTFRRIDDRQTGMTVDFVRVGGAWQLGADDNGRSELGGTGELYYNYCYNVGQNDIKQLVGALATQGYYSYLNLYFPVSEWAAENLGHRLTIKSDAKNEIAFTLRLNGAKSLYAQFAENELYNGGEGALVAFPAGTLDGGNFLKFSCPDDISGPSGRPVWTGIDFWRFETVWTGSNYDELSAITVR